MHRDRLQQPCPWPASSKHAEKAAPPAANRRGSRLGHAAKRPEQHHSTPSQKGGQSGTGINSFIHHPTRHLSAEPILQESHYATPVFKPRNGQRPASTIPSSITPSLSVPFSSYSLPASHTVCARSKDRRVPLLPLSNASCKRSDMYILIPIPSSVRHRVYTGYLENAKTTINKRLTAA